MAEETKSVTSVVGDVTKAINDAWEFFLPATIRAFAAVATIAFLGGIAPLRAAFQWLAGALVSVDLKTLAELLDKYKLTPLVPIVTLFIFATLAHSFNRIVFAVAGLIPIRLSSSSTTLLAKTGCAPVWYRMPDVARLEALPQAMDFELAKARVSGEQVLLGNLDYWTKRQSDHIRQFSFAKFLALWSVAWAFIFAHMPNVPPGTFIRLLSLLILIVGCAAVALLRGVYAIEQTGYAKCAAMTVLLEMKGIAELPSTDEKRKSIDQQIEMLRNHGWWWITIGSVDWARMVKDFDTNSSIISGIRSRWSKRG